MRAYAVACLVVLPALGGVVVSFTCRRRGAIGVSKLALRGPGRASAVFRLGATSRTGGWLDLSVVVVVAAAVVILVIVGVPVIEAVLSRCVPVRTSCRPPRCSRPELFVLVDRWPHMVRVAQGKTTHSVHKMEDGPHCGEIADTTQHVESLS